MSPSQLPGHVSVITGTACYEFLARDYGVAGVVAGFEAHDVLQALLRLVRQARPAIEIEYGREARRIGFVTAAHLGRVALRTPFGTRRVLDMPVGELLPRIC